MVSGRSVVGHASLRLFKGDVLGGSGSGIRAAQQLEPLGRSATLDRDS